MERQLVEHGAATLASLKAGSVFRYRPEDYPGLMRETAFWDARLRRMGVRLRVLCWDGGVAMMYLWRPTQLAASLAQPGAAALLSRCGYASAEPEAATEQLIRRLKAGGDFPHELGLFLGYPMEDVEGFIQHQGRDCKFTGCWKVYGDAEAAAQRFRRLRRCRNLYARLWRAGVSVERLTVAA